MSGLWLPAGPTVQVRPPSVLLQSLRDEAVREAQRRGHNVLHGLLTRANGEVIDLGYSENLITNAGKDLLAAAQGHATGKGGALTAISATSATPSGGGLTTDQYKGWRVYCPVTGVTTEPVYGNIGSNSTTVLTIDQWWKADDTTGTTPASTNGYSILAAADFRFIALTTDAGAAAAGDTTLASEITTNGGARALGTYAHTGGTSTYTLQKTFSFTGTFTAIHKVGLFNCLTSTAAGIMGFEVVANQDATVGNGDTATYTWTDTLS